MSQTKTLRERKRQLGQFLTPPDMACDLVSEFPFTQDDKVLEPSMGDGSFILPLIEKFLALYHGTLEERLDNVLKRNIYGTEIDRDLYDRCLTDIKNRWGYLPSEHNFICKDFFLHWFTDEFSPSYGTLFDDRIHFDYIIGNPPFGGTIAPDIQDRLDRELGWRNGLKIKKETYAFFLVKCLDLLKPGGQLRFICSDTFLTINTMQGLRRLLMETGQASVDRLELFSEETKYAMVVLDFAKTGPAKGVLVDGKFIPRQQIVLTGNHSWQITDDYATYFAGPKLGDFVIATSGMTVGANEFFVRPIVSGKITEPYEFSFVEEPITLEREIQRARLGLIAPKKRAEIFARECRGETRRNVIITQRAEPLEITLPHPDYQFYNKATRSIVYAPPSHVLYWKDDGDAVLTFKKNGNWYLYGVGGQKFFGREGLTWQLISQTLNTRWLPPGYILDSGAPCAFLQEGVPQDELYFILGWTFSPLCQKILKDVINHTKNIQGKDFERLPYPFWVEAVTKQEIIARVKTLVREAMAGRVFGWGDREVIELGEMFD